MDAPPKSIDPFNETADQSAPLLIQGHSADEQTDKTYQCTEGPPLYQHPFFVDGAKSDQNPAPSQHSSVPAVLDATSESEWYNTLRELHMNMADLRIARGRASRFSTLASLAPQRFCAHKFRGAEERTHEVHVLEELVLAGMRRLSHIHPDPLIQAEWNSRAEQFARTLHSNDDSITEGNIALSGAEGAVSDDLESARGQRFQHRAARLFASPGKDTPLTGLAKGFGLLLFTPIALAGAAIFGAGAILYGSGKIVVELGHVMTCGKLR